MSHRVVTEACVNCKYGDCVEVCPVNCFFEENDMLIINPDECIDCEACDSECPVEAIVSDDDADEKWIKRNSETVWDEEKRRYKKDEVTPGPENTERSA